MRKHILLFVLLLSLNTYGQLSVNMLTPPMGMIDKQQLWNMIVVNTGKQPLNLYIQLTLTDAVTGEPILSATTTEFAVPVGSKQVSADLFGPVQYNILSSSYHVDPSPTGLLPIGTFNVCYNFLQFKLGNQVFQECVPVNIPPLNPPLLTTPENGSKIEEARPLFMWLPPAPAEFFAQLRYDFKLVEVYPNQSPAVAIQQNVPVLLQHAVLSNNLQYPLGATLLDSTKHYAWQVTADNNLNEIGKSETWVFGFSNADSNATPLTPEPMYVKMKKESEGYGIFFNRLRLDYFNETSDSTWKIVIQDASLPSSSSFVLALDTNRMTSGQNLLDYDATKDHRFINHHIYLLQMPNSRGELWKLRFEYIKKINYTTN